MAGSKKAKQTKKSKKAGNVARLVREYMLSIAEDKVNSLNVVGTTSSTAGIIYNISNNIVQGDNIFERTGTKIYLTKFHIYYRCFAITNPQSFRFILFRDMFNQGTTVTVTDVLPTGTWLSQYSDVRQIQQKRFEILDDWVVDSNTQGEVIRSRNRTLKGRWPVLYNGATAVATANGKGTVFLLVIGSAITGAYDWRIQMEFNDS